MNISREERLALALLMAVIREILPIALRESPTARKGRIGEADIDELIRSIDKIISVLKEGPCEK